MVAQDTPLAGLAVYYFTHPGSFQPGHFFPHGYTAYPGALADHYGPDRRLFVAVALHSQMAEETQVKRFIWQRLI
jgi:hypothetical protein